MARINPARLLIWNATNGVGVALPGSRNLESRRWWDGEDQMMDGSGA